MQENLSRRTFLKSASGLIFAGAIGKAFAANPEINLDDYVPLKITSRTIEVNGKSATVYGLLQKNGAHGLTIDSGKAFRVNLQNMLDKPTAIHWHGLHPPNFEDGVPGITQPLIQPHTSILYDFPVRPTGTHFMHSHNGFQSIKMLSAPLIVHDADASKNDEQEVIVLLHDFSFREPEEIFQQLTKTNSASNAMASMTGMSGMDMKGMDMSADMKGMDMSTDMKGMDMSKMSGSMKMPSTMKMDLNDFDYDAYLANDRSLKDPEVVSVEKRGRVRLRIINASTSTNYFIDLGQLNGEAIACDGMAIVPSKGNRFPIASAQRLDIRVELPDETGAYPILARREGGSEITGIILANPGATVSKLPERAAKAHGALNLEWEKTLVAANQFDTKPVDVTSVLRLTGDMAKYVWGINNKAYRKGDKPFVTVKAGQRAALKFVNQTGMSHPMHLHGHSFQVSEIDGVPLKGAVRDTVLVPPRSSVTVLFDAINPGVWFLHCHIAWHLERGMATTVSYSA